MCYDCKRVPLEFSVGDKVLLSTKHLQVEGTRKLQARFIGPFTVEARVGKLAYGWLWGLDTLAFTLFFMLVCFAGTSPEEMGGRSVPL